VTQPFPFTYGRPEVPVGTGVGIMLYQPIENVVLPSYVTPLDFTTVTQVYFNVLRTLDQTMSTWVAQSLTNVTAGGLVAVYQFGANDLYIACPYLLRPWCVTPATSPKGVPCRVGTLYVVSP
jgi:hypothetical protein